MTTRMKMFEEKKKFFLIIQKILQNCDTLSVSEGGNKTIVYSF